MDKLLKKLIPPFSVSGRESEIADVIESVAKRFGDTSRDALGNLVVHRPGNGARIMLAAHMDTVGLTVTHVEEGGFARFANIGGLWPISLVGQRVRFENGIIGVICADRGTEPKGLTLEKLYVDPCGAELQVGDAAAYCSEPIFQNGMVISPYLDNRLGCAVCLRALELLEHCENEIFCVFTVQEEVGVRGAGPAAYEIAPDLAIAVDICGLQDYPGEARQNSLKITAGPLIKLMDARVICHASVVKRLEDAAARLNLQTQRYVTKRGGTDAGGIFGTRGGVPTGVLSIPIRYTHGPNEIADLSVAEDCAKLLAEAIQK